MVEKKPPLMDNVSETMLRDLFTNIVEGKTNEWTFGRLNKEVSFNGWINQGQYCLCWQFYAPYIILSKDDLRPELVDVMIKKGDDACKIRGLRSISFIETEEDQGTIILNLQDSTSGLEEEDRVVIGKITTAEQMNELYNLLKQFISSIEGE